jgi:hypothetical protein
MQNGLMVPYITQWSAEKTMSPLIVRRRTGTGIGFADETLHDRDDDGVLWVRQSFAPGCGEADYLRVHSLRQRRATRRLLCQGCSADTLALNPERQLFMLKDVGRPIAEGERTTAAPVCRACAQVSDRHCPHLRRHVAAWVERPFLWGVAGILHDPRTLRPLPGKDLVQVAYEAPELPWVLAVRQVLSLRGCTATTLNDLATDTGAC